MIRRGCIMFSCSLIKQEFKGILKNISNDCILSYIDFSENYAFKTQNEVQDMHRYNFQISILVHITYRKNLYFDNTTFDQNPTILKEVHYYISDDKTHDSLFVQHALTFHQEYLKGKGCYLEEHIIWNDGCFAQFKSA